MRTSFLIRYSAIVGLMLTSACATAIKGTTEDVVFNSDPPGARVTTTNGFTCTTPCTINMDRDDEFVATFKLSGLEKKVSVGTDYDDGSAAAIAGTVLFAPLIVAPIGLAVDAATGANLTHVPNPVNVTFAKLKESPSAIVAAAVQSSTSTSEQPAPSVSSFERIADSPPLYEGSSYAAFTKEQISAYCAQDWSTRNGPDGRTEYNPCTMRSAFR
ncbi:MAG: hypothetical protein AAGD13_12780 [Pseudomonadota bacterium]